MKKRVVSLIVILIIFSVMFAFSVKAVKSDLTKIYGDPFGRSYASLRCAGLDSYVFIENRAKFNPLLADCDSLDKYGGVLTKGEIEDELVINYLNSLEDFQVLEYSDSQQEYYSIEKDELGNPLLEKISVRKNDETKEISEIKTVSYGTNIESIVDKKNYQSIFEKKDVHFFLNHGVNPVERGLSGEHSRTISIEEKVIIPDEKHPKYVEGVRKFHYLIYKDKDGNTNKIVERPLDFYDNLHESNYNVISSIGEISEREKIMAESTDITSEKKLLLAAEFEKRTRIHTVKKAGVKLGTNRIYEVQKNPDGTHSYFLITSGAKGEEVPVKLPDNSEIMSETDRYDIYIGEHPEIIAGKNLNHVSETVLPPTSIGSQPVLAVQNINVKRDAGGEITRITYLAHGEENPSNILESETWTKDSSETSQEFLKRHIEDFNDFNDLSNKDLFSEEKILNPNSKLITDQCVTNPDTCLEEAHKNQVISNVVSSDELEQDLFKKSISQIAEEEVVEEDAAEDAKKAEVIKTLEEAEKKQIQETTDSRTVPVGNGAGFIERTQKGFADVYSRFSQAVGDNTLWMLLLFVIIIVAAFSYRRRFGKKTPKIARKYAAGGEVHDGLLASTLSSKEKVIAPMFKFQYDDPQIPVPILIMTKKNVDGINSLLGLGNRLEVQLFESVPKKDNAIKNCINTYYVTPQGGNVYVLAFEEASVHGILNNDVINSYEDVKKFERTSIIFTNDVILFQGRERGFYFAKIKLLKEGESAEGQEPSAGKESAAGEGGKAPNGFWVPFSNDVSNASDTPSDWYYHEFVVKDIFPKDKDILLHESIGISNSALLKFKGAIQRANANNRAYHFFVPKKKTVREKNVKNGGFIQQPVTVDKKNFLDSDVILPSYLGYSKGDTVKIYYLDGGISTEKTISKNLFVKCNSEKNIPRSVIKVPENFLKSLVSSFSSTDLNISDVQNKRVRISFNLESLSGSKYSFYDVGYTFLAEEDNSLTKFVDDVKMASVSFAVNADLFDKISPYFHNKPASAFNVSKISFNKDTYGVTFVFQSRSSQEVKIKDVTKKESVKKKKPKSLKKFDLERVESLKKEITKDEIIRHIRDYGSFSKQNIEATIKNFTTSKSKKIIVKHIQKILKELVDDKQIKLVKDRYVLAKK